MRKTLLRSATVLAAADDPEVRMRVQLALLVLDAQRTVGGRSRSTRV